MNVHHRAGRNGLNPFIRSNWTLGMRLYDPQTICFHKYCLRVFRGFLNARWVTSAGKVGVFLDVFVEEFSNWKYPLQ